jgi:hypothetical protein
MAERGTQETNPFLRRGWPASRAKAGPGSIHKSPQLYANRETNRDEGRQH